MERRSNRYPALLWSVLLGVIALDLVTKWIAVRELAPSRIPRQVMGDFVQFTLVYNPGAAFGLHLGPYSRWIFMGLTAVALYVLGRLYVTARDGEWQKVLAVALVCAGAVGNLVDRIRSPRGVVDFIDVGLGAARWPTFNVADMAISCGAVLLAWVLWWEEDPAKADAAAPTVAQTGEGAGGD